MNENGIERNVHASSNQGDANHLSLNVEDDESLKMTETDIVYDATNYSAAADDSDKTSSDDTDDATSDGSSDINQDDVTENKTVVKENGFSERSSECQAVDPVKREAIPLHAKAAAETDDVTLAKPIIETPAPPVEVQQTTNNDHVTNDRDIDKINLDNDDARDKQSSAKTENMEAKPEPETRKESGENKYTVNVETERTIPQIPPKHDTGNTQATRDSTSRLSEAQRVTSPTKSRRGYLNMREQFLRGLDQKINVNASWDPFQRRRDPDRYNLERMFPQERRNVGMRNVDYYHDRAAEKRRDSFQRPYDYVGHDVPVHDRTSDSTFLRYPSFTPSRVKDGGFQPKRSPGVREEYAPSRISLGREDFPQSRVTVTKDDFTFHVDSSLLYEQPGNKKRVYANVEERGHGPATPEYSNKRYSGSEKDGGYREKPLETPASTSDGSEPGKPERLPSEQQGSRESLDDSSERYADRYVHRDAHGRDHHDRDYRDDHAVRHDDYEVYGYPENYDDYPYQRHRYDGNPPLYSYPVSPMQMLPYCSCVPAEDTSYSLVPYVPPSVYNPLAVYQQMYSPHWRQLLKVLSVLVSHYAKVVDES